MKKLRARNGHNAGPQNAAAGQPQESPALMPTDFALRVMHDETQPTALRVSAAKLAASLLPRRVADVPAAEDKPDTQSEARRDPKHGRISNSPGASFTSSIIPTRCSKSRRRWGTLCPSGIA
jgi:hypothetical protein